MGIIMVMPMAQIRRVCTFCSVTLPDLVMDDNRYCLFSVWCLLSLLVTRKWPSNKNPEKKHGGSCSLSLYLSPPVVLLTFLLTYLLPHLLPRPLALYSLSKSIIQRPKTNIVVEVLLIFSLFSLTFSRQRAFADLILQIRLGFLNSDELR